MTEEIKCLNWDIEVDLSKNLSEINQFNTIERYPEVKTSIKAKFNQEYSFLAFVSRDFGADRIAEGALLGHLLFRRGPNADAIPVSLFDFLSVQPVSPLIAEIKAHSITLI